MHGTLQVTLSVIIPTLNEAEHLPNLLAGLSQQQNILLEIIIADGGSGDATEAVAGMSDALFLTAPRGRGAQMNAAAAVASGEYLLFLHADSALDDPLLLSNAVHTMMSEPDKERCRAGHFRLRFARTSGRNELAYRYMEEKSALNRANTTNGDQGLLLTAEYFRQLGGFDEELPFLEDQKITEKIRLRGELITLPGFIYTSARRFETEGLHRRRILMAMMMGLYSIGAAPLFARASGVYRTQHEAGSLLLTPFFRVIRCMMRNEWGLDGTARNFYLLGRYVRQNSWQLFFYLDVALRPTLGAGRNPFLVFHDRVFEPCTDNRAFNALTGILCFVWFMVILAPVFQLLELYVKKQPRQPASNRDN